MPLPPRAGGALEDTPSPGKRPKLKHVADSASHATARPAGTENMYAFANNVIDLTSSPPRNASSRMRRASNAASLAAGGGAASSSPRKLVVKNLQPRPKHDPEKYRNQVWSQLEEVLHIILFEETTKYSIEEMYRGVENLCRQNWAPELSRRLQRWCTDHIVTSVKPRLEKWSAGSAGELVERVVEEWTRWRKQTTAIQSIFYYLDRSYLLRTSGEKPIDDLCIDLFRTHVFHDDLLRSKLLDGTCGLLSADRGETPPAGFDAELFRSVIAMFHSMAVYTSEVEPKILGTSQAFFVDWAREHAAAADLTLFLTQCRHLKDRELERCDRFSLPGSTKRDLTNQIHTHLIEQQCKRLTRATDVGHLIAVNDAQILEQLFNWLEVKSLGENLRTPVAQYIDQEGTSIIFDESRESEMVVRLLQLKKKVDTLWERAFARHKSLGHGMREAFSTFMNKNKRDAKTGGAGNDKPGEMIAKYVDLILKGGTKAIPQMAVEDSTLAPTEDDVQRQDDELDEDEAINRQLDSVLDLFRFVQGKATFEAFYKKDLAKRLLMNRSASADAEKSMLTRLRNNCGASFTHNLEQMFKDVERSREENAAYKALLEDRHERRPFDLSVNTLSAAAWPSYPDTAVAIPPDIHQATTEFEKHYRAKYVGRKLDWKHGLAHCQMRAYFPRGIKDLVLSSFQAIVLLHFNDRGADAQPLTYAELQAATQLPDAELQRTLQSLACAKYRVLTKSPRGREVAPTDKFIVNLSFHDPRSRIKINQIQLKETPEEQRQTHERVAADRQFETQAAIVRIMKREKSIKHARLIAEVIGALKSRGAINAEDIKKQIEKLIDKDYMERSAEGGYEYVA